MSDERPLVYGLLAGFQTSAELTHAIHQTRDRGFVSIEAYTPFPDEEVTEALGKHGSLLPLLVLLGGIAGGVGGYLMQYWMMAVSYPLIVGGKPLNSWPMFVPVTFELTILLRRPGRGAGDARAQRPAEAAPPAV